MANDVYTTYTFYGEDLPKFVEDWNKIKELYGEQPGGSDITEFYKLGGEPRCYLYDEEKTEDSLILMFWDAWYPHSDELWPDFYDLYGDVEYTTFAYDNDNWKSGFINTAFEGSPTRYRVLWIDEEGNPFNDYFSDLDEAVDYAEENAKEYIIQKAWDEIEMFDEPNELVAQSEETSQVEEIFNL